MSAQGDLNGGVSLLAEREAELARIQELCSAASGGHGAMLLLQGQAGVGKTRLVEAGRTHARAAGLRTLEAHGSTLGRDRPFGIVLELLSKELRRRDGESLDVLFSGAAARARTLWFPDSASSPPVGADGAGLSSNLDALFWVASGIAEEGPLLMAIDDAHWADIPSLRFLAYLERRLGDLPVAVVASVRTGEADGTQATLLAELLAAVRSDSIEVEPLSKTGVAAVVRARGFEATDDSAAACFEATGGNPLLLAELLTSLEHAPGGISRNAVEAANPKGVAAFVEARLLRLGDEAQGVAGALTTLGGRASLHRAATLAGIDIVPASEAAARLVSSEIVSQDDLELSFVHPLVEAAVRDRVPAPARSLEHWRAAQQLRSEGAITEEVASHLLESLPTGEPWVLDMLRDAANSALHRGASEAAVAYLRRALLEPLPDGRRTDVVRSLGAAETVALQPEAIDRFEELLRETKDLAERARLHLELGKAASILGMLDESIRYLREGSDELQDDEGLADLRIQLDAEHVNVGLQIPAMAAEIGERLARNLAELEARGGGTGYAASSLYAHGALFAAISCQPWESCHDLVHKALAGGELVATATTGDSNALWAASGVLTSGGQTEANIRLLNDAVAEAQRRGSVAAFASASYCRGTAHYHAGNLREAAADLESAIEAKRDGWAQYLIAAYAYYAHTLIDMGALDEAEETLRTASQERPEDALPHAVAKGARGRLRLAQGRPAEALEDFDEWAAMAFPCPAFLSDWRHNASRASAQLGDTDRALELAETELAASRAFGAPRPIGNALVARGLAEPRDAGIETMREAVAVLAASESKFDHARAQVELGSALRRAAQSKEARDLLAAGLERAQVLGSPALAARAREELIVAGGRPHSGAGRSSTLTPGELRVALLARDGRTNRQIAEALFVTIKAVEWHLGNTYRKLGIGGRTELAEALEPTELS